MTYKLTTKEDLEKYYLDGLTGTGAITRANLTVLMSLAEKLMAEREIYRGLAFKYCDLYEAEIKGLKQSECSDSENIVDAEAARVMEKESK